MEQIRELNRLRGLMVEHGRMSFYEKEVEPEMGIDLVVKFIQEHRYRLIDLFFRLDKDRSGEVTCREFKRGLKETGLGMSDVRHMVWVFVLLHCLFLCQSCVCLVLLCLCLE